jgi:hypothetical protein
MEAPLHESRPSTARDKPRTVLERVFDEARVLDIRRLAFYLGVPLLLGLYSAINNPMLMQIGGLSVAISFYLGHSLIPWWINAGTTRLTMIGLAFWRPHRIVLLAIGSVCAGFVTLPYMVWLYTGLPASPAVPGSMEAFEVTGATFWSYQLRAAVVWIGVNLVFDRYLGLPRYRYSGAGKNPDARRKAQRNERQLPEQGASAGLSSSPAAIDDEDLYMARPRFLEKLDTSVDVQDILAIKAEEHYIRLVTADREYMIYCKFADAVDQLSPRLGIRVHRSHWVNYDAIAGVRKAAKKLSLQLKCGAFAAVSRPYQAMVLQMAKSRLIPTVFE